MNESHNLCQGGYVSAQGQTDAKVFSRSVLRQSLFFVYHLTPFKRSAKVMPLITAKVTVCHKTGVLVLNTPKPVT